MTDQAKDTQISQNDEYFLGLFRTVSMHVSNDPRFYTDNIINYRLAALGSLSIVSGLMIDTCMGTIMDMDKRMRPNDLHCGTCQFVSFILLMLVFFANIVATYIGVAQPYHVIRLMTSGPTGVESASQYYLNPNIVAWRHQAVKAMLVSMPVFLVSCGLRLVTKFERANRQRAPLPEDTPTWAWFAGRGFAVVMALAGLVIVNVHLKHFSVFQDRYKNRGLKNGYHEYARSIYSTRPRGASDLDV